MPVRIFNNITSINSQRILGANNDRLAQSVERIASGIRINRGADDAAGLAISESLRSDIRTLRQAVRNGNDGISMINITEGALNEQGGILIRLRELASQAATGTVGSTERQTIQLEFNALRNELITINSPRLYNEMKTFVWNNGKAQSMRGFNDDLILSCAIGCWVKDLVYTVGQRDIEYKKAFMESMMCNTTKINTSIPGMIGYRKSSQDNEKDKYKEFSWILKG